MKKLLSAAIVAVLALSNVAFAECVVNGQPSADAKDEAACTKAGGTWTAPAAKAN